MQAALASLLLVPVLAAGLDDGAAIELKYRGNLAPVDRDGAGQPVRRFNLYCLVARHDDNSRKLTFLVDERGTGGGWNWPERFGQMEFDSQLHHSNPVRIKLLHELEESLHPVTLDPPFFEFTENLAAGAKWNSGKSAYKVTGSAKVGERDCWEVVEETNFGRNRTIHIDKQNSIVVASQRRLTLGRGDSFLLSMELTSAESIDQDRLTRLEPPVKTLQALQKSLKRREDETEPHLTENQLEEAAKVVESLAKQAESTPFARLASAISRDVSTQRQRSDDVTKLAQKFLGQPTPLLNLKSLEGKTLAAEKNDGKIVVLHFWKYHDEPLVQPYGQVGYLDFLYSKRRKLGVNVYGVAVDSRFGSDKNKSAALRDVRKLREFMNLSYPIAVDDGGLLGKFGDPQRVGAKLPLWVVVDPDGKIAHYHAGFYEINPDEGLRQLDGLLIELIKKQRAAEK